MLGLSNSSLFRIAQELTTELDGDLVLNLVIGNSYIQNVVIEYLNSIGQGYDNNQTANRVVEEVFNNASDLESVLQEDWADVVNVSFDNSATTSGYLELDDEVENLSFSELDELEITVNEFIKELTGETIDQLQPDDLIWIPVESSNVQSFAYDERNRIFYVRFLEKTNYPSTVYRYFEVESEIYNQFFMAPSKGRAVWQLLRDRYDYERIE